MKDVKAKPLTPETKCLGQNYLAELGGEHGPRVAHKQEGYIFQLRSKMENIENIKKNPFHRLKMWLISLSLLHFI